MGPEFEKTFKDVCRIIAQEIDREERNTGNATVPDQLTPSLPHITGASRPETTLGAPNDRLQYVDRATALFRVSLIEQLNATQEAENRQSTVLKAQVKDLEIRIECVEAERRKLNTELVEAKREAEKWKAQYEGLKRAIQDTMKRCS